MTQCAALSRNILFVRKRMEEAAKRAERAPETIALICVTKGRTAEEIREAISCGITDIGENRVQEAKEKHRNFSGLGIKWHLVGHLQTNKVKDAVAIFDLIHSVDSTRLAEAINKEAARINKVQDVLVEVNTSLEATKFGVRADEIMDLVKQIINLKNIKLLGFMTMAPSVKDKEEARPYFRKLRELRDCFVGLRPPRNDVIASPDDRRKSRREGAKQSLFSQFFLPVLSMGMSQDYEVAIEEGATMVRIGRAIFEEQK